MPSTPRPIANSAAILSLFCTALAVLGFCIPFVPITFGSLAFLFAIIGVALAASGRGGVGLSLGALFIASLPLIGGIVMTFVVGAGVAGLGAAASAVGTAAAQAEADIAKEKASAKKKPITMPTPKKIVAVEPPATRNSDHKEKETEQRPPTATASLAATEKPEAKPTEEPPKESVKNPDEEIELDDLAPPQPLDRPLPPLKASGTKRTEAITRTWTDSKGRTIDAAFVEHVGATVTLQKRDGKQLKIPINKLSEEDREFLRQQRMHGAK